MPFVKGAPKPAGSGRKRGSDAKRISIGHSQLPSGIAEKLRALGCDPIEGMARLAMDKANPPELRGRMFAELAQYEHPKRRATDMRFVDESGKDRPFLLSDADRLIAESDAADATS